MLLARAAFSTTPGKSASAIPQARSGGTLSSAQSARTQSMPSSALGFIAAGKQARDGGVAFQGGMLRRARSQRGYIGRHAVRQQRRTERAVRRLPPASERRREAMHHAQSGVGQRQAAEQAGQRHVAARLPIRAVVVRAAQRTGNAPDALDANCIHQWIGARAHIRLDELRQGVKAGECGDRRRQPVGQLGIDQRDPRQHQRAAQAGFDAVLRRSEHGVARDFAAGAGRGGHRNERQRRDRNGAALSHHLEKLERLAAVGGNGGNRFAGVNCAASANAR